jgi:hypothetical protein
MEDWTIHPDGKYLDLFRRKDAVLVSRKEMPDELRLFVSEGNETHPDINLARLFLRRSGRALSEAETRSRDFIADIYARAAVADDRIRICYVDHSMFWSRSRSNRRCAFCKIDGTDGWEW